MLVLRRFASDVGYRMAKILELYKESNFYEQWHLIPQQRMKNMIFPHNLWRPFFDCMSQLFLDPNMCGFQYIVGSPDPPLTPNSSGQLAELIVYIIPPE